MTAKLTVVRGDAVKCPECDGHKQVFVHLHTRDSKTHGFQWIKCLLCDGTGEITQEQHEMKMAGLVVRKFRVERHIGLSRGARALGLSLIELSNIERGRAAVPDGWREKLAAESNGGGS